MTVIGISGSSAFSLALAGGRECVKDGVRFFFFIFIISCFGVMSVEKDSVLYPGMGKAFSWGNNDQGNLGVGDTADRYPGLLGTGEG